MSADIAIGVPGALGPAAVRMLAPRVERAGFAALWVNDTPDGDSIRALAAAAEATAHLRLATGVIPVDRRPGDRIAADVRAAGVPEERLTIGIGSGRGSAGALERVGAAIDVLSAELAAGVVVGALGPRMRRLAAERADGVLLSWLSPQSAADQALEIRSTERRPLPRVALYARTIVDEDARGVLGREAAGYASSPHYAANFARLGIDALDTVLPPRDAPLAEGVRRYAVADELVLRAITPNGTLDELLAFVDRAAVLLADQGTGLRPIP